MSTLRNCEEVSLMTELGLMKYLVSNKVLWHSTYFTLIIGQEFARNQQFLQEFPRSYNNLQDTMFESLHKNLQNSEMSHDNWNDFARIYKLLH